MQTCRTCCRRYTVFLANASRPRQHHDAEEKKRYRQQHRKGLYPKGGRSQHRWTRRLEIASPVWNQENGVPVALSSDVHSPVEAIDELVTKEGWAFVFGDREKMRQATLIYVVGVGQKQV